MLGWGRSSRSSDRAEEDAVATVSPRVIKLPRHKYQATVRATMPATTSAKVSLGAKILELILACVCIALHRHSYGPYHFLLPITFGGYIIICAILVAGMCIKQRAPRLMDLAFTIVGMVLFIAAGAIALEFHTNKHVPIHSNEGIAMGAIAIINAFVFLIDAFFIYKDVHEYAPTQ